MEGRKLRNYSGHAGVYQQRECGENRSSVYPPPVQTIGSKDHKDKKMPLSGRDMNTHNEPMDTTNPGSPGGKFDKGQVLKSTDVPTHRIKEEVGINDTITIYVRGPGHQRKHIQTYRNSPIDHLIREANVAFGFGQRPSDTYVVHAGTELINGTGQTVAQAGIQNYGELDLLKRTLGGLVVP